MELIETKCWVLNHHLLEGEIVQLKDRFTYTLREEGDTWVSDCYFNKFEEAVADMEEYIEHYERAQKVREENMVWREHYLQGLSE